MDNPVYAPFQNQENHANGWLRGENPRKETPRAETDPADMNRNQVMLFAQDLKRTYTAVKNAHRDLEQSYMDTLNCLILASEYKDDNTGSHLKRIGSFSVLIAKELELPDPMVEQIGLASAMHDIGKIGIPDHILLKKGKLSKSEFAVMKTHTLIGARILEGTHSEILRLAHNIAISHHEWWNGEGYPCGLKGTQIPLEGRIVALADFFDACTSHRPYREAMPLDTVLKMIRRERGRQFEPRLVDLFLRKHREIRQLMRNHEPQRV